ncbi:16S rRNA maturation RNase YbeY [Sulfuricaulis limicola]|uniref:Endoribonuclease YbeY n=1 Tax=Sulfuricaulis limicola TaxID=1620215 RepID=A0A1B4XE09_9GAMM|nr:rRNA maturation RNase YbeY [Sulfuricaulis limicola]BAV33045.1 16S rRNA maturation RNase YbeY [Sulfuricaulis limicola]
MNLQLRVQYAAARAGLPARSSLQRWASTALRGLGRERVALGVRIVGVAESADLNRRFRRKHGPTNVLSFPFEAPSGTRSEVLGDLVICAPVVRREARAQRKPERAHWAHMVVHGILHLRGYDHLNRRDATVMEKKEIRILEELGFANPYLS